jgi:hypothetical protein
LARAEALLAREAAVAEECFAWFKKPTVYLKEEATASLKKPPVYPKAAVAAAVPSGDGERDYERELKGIPRNEMTDAEKYEADILQIDSLMYIPVNWGEHDSHNNKRR